MTVLLLVSLIGLLRPLSLQACRHAPSRPWFRPALTAVALFLLLASTQPSTAPDAAPVHRGPDLVLVPAAPTATTP